jgi:FkbM family methyltransferase
MKTWKPKQSVHPVSLWHHQSLAHAAGNYRPYFVAGGTIYLDIGESKMMRARALGRYELNKMNLVKNWLQPGATFVDVGANKGDFTLLAAKVVGSHGEVLSFEPEPSNCFWIRKSIEANSYENIKLYDLALSGADGTASLYLGRKSGWHTLVPGCPARDQGVIGVVTRKLDSVLKEADQAKVGMIKIDVEGVELEVLKGAHETLSNNDDLVLLLDLHPYLGVDQAEVFKLLEELDFKVYKVQPPFNIPASANTQLSEILAYRGQGKSWDHLSQRSAS